MRHLDTEDAGKKGGVWEVTRRLGKKQDEFAVLKKGITMWQSVIKKYGFI